VLLDTHFLIWALVNSPRLTEFPWLNDHRPWAISPVSFLEIQFLGEVGKIEVESLGLIERVETDPRFMTDDISTVVLIEHALPLDWTRDPFDRLLAAHSSARRLPLCTTDQLLRRRHAFIPEQLRLRA
jgi:PIN domain nuclease of toxin-antitoxin system